MGILTTLARRSGRRAAGRAWRGAALATALWVAGCGGPPDATCPAGAPVEVDLEAWREALVEAARSTAADAAGERDRLLGQLALPPLTGSAEGPAPGAGLSGPTDYQELPVRRPGGASDKLVAVRFRAADGAELLRAQLLRPVPGHERLFCPLGDDLSRDREAHEEPCLEPHDGPARSLTAVPLVAADRHAVMARDAGGWCGPGTSRADRFATSWWGVEGDRLVRYLEVVTHESQYESPAPPSRVRRAEIELSTGWPREFTVAETVECPSPEDVADTSCRPVERVTRYRYTDGSYAAVDDPGPEAGPAPGDEETDP